MTSLDSWVDIDAQSDFSLANVPFGVGKSRDRVFVATRLGDTVIDLTALHKLHSLGDGLDEALNASTLNPLMAAGRPAARIIRERVQEWFAAGNDTLTQEERGQVCLPADQVEMLLPADIRDYTDFYSSIEHATNMGSMFRDPDNALLPNWKHLPVGYNGRASSIVVSGTPVKRPQGQTRPDDDKPPQYGPSRLWDIELEMGFFTGPGTALGSPVPVDKAPEHIFGMVLVNDWSARDIQKWEYVPLGPFLGKSFGTSVSPWVVTLDALEPFRVKQPDQDPPVLPYLQGDPNWGLNIELEVWLATQKQTEPVRISATNFRTMYWTIVQQLAHQTVNGTNIRPGDLYASGTVSGSSPDSYGSLLELAWKGTKPIKLPSGEERKFLQDGDTVTLKGWCQGDGYRVGFGEVSGAILPAAPRT